MGGSDEPLCAGNGGCGSDHPRRRHSSSTPRIRGVGYTSEQDQDKGGE
jgi:hypothetical protein